MTATKPHVIIVDDDEAIRYLIRRIITRQFPRVAVSEAGDGLEALKLFEGTGADLMIVDHNLPHLNGADLVRELRSRAVAIPLVMISSFAAVGEEAKKAGATLFVHKDDINAGLKQHLPGMLAER